MEIPSIYVACLASYNNAILHGVWIDATQSEDEIMEEIWSMLENSPEPNAEEYAIHDYEGFGNIPIHEKVWNTMRIRNKYLYRSVINHIKP